MLTSPCWCRPPSKSVEDSHSEDMVEAMTAFASAKSQDSPNTTESREPRIQTVELKTPKEVSQDVPPGPVNVHKKPNPPAEATAVKDPSIEPNSEGENPAGSGSPSGRLPDGIILSPPPQSQRSDIESLYASPSPKATVDLEPIELDSDPDFEMLEQMLLSHRGTQPSQSVKKEVLSQPPILPGISRTTLKRQRSDPSHQESPTQEPQADRPAKRPRAKGSRSSVSATALNDRKKHPEFWDLDGTVVLQVDDIIFRVMRSTLSKASPWFQRLFSENLEHVEIMAGCPVYVIDEDVSPLDFSNLLGGLENGLWVERLNLVCPTS